MGAPIIWNGNNAKLLKPNLDFGESLVKTGTFSAANNQAVAADVTGLLISGRGAQVVLSVHVVATNSAFTIFDFLIIQKNANWEISQGWTGDPSPVTFSISSTGQIQYISSDELGHTSTTIKWKSDSLDA